MDFKEAKIDGVNIIYDESVIYTQKEWLKLSTDDASQDIDGVHGRIVSPSLARFRVITLSWYIDRAFSWEQEKIEHLRRLFALQDDDLFEVQDKELYIKDLFNNEWILGVKVKEPLEVVEGDENFYWQYWKWRVVLESTKTPIYKSKTQNIIEWQAGKVWWWKLWVKLGKAMNESSAIIQANTTSTKTPVKFVIKATGNITSPITIRNIITNDFFALNIWAVNGDEIIIDGDKYLATKNGVNVIINKVAWSVWPRIKWNNQFTVYDWLQNKNFTIKVYFHNSML